MIAYTPGSPIVAVDAVSISLLVLAPMPHLAGA